MNNNIFGLGSLQNKNQVQTVETLKKSQFNELGMLRYRLDRGDEEYKESFYNTIIMDGSENNISDSPATIVERTGGMPSASPFNNVTFPVPDGVGYSLYFASTSANDTAAGTGARKIYVRGLNADWDRMTEEITLNGQTGVATIKTNWLRINKVFVSDVGTSTLNEGIVYISSVNDFVSGVPQTNVINAIQMQYGYGTIGIFSVPRYHRLYFTRGSYYVNASAFRYLENRQYDYYAWGGSGAPNDNRIKLQVGALNTATTVGFNTEGAAPEFATTDIEFTTLVSSSRFTKQDKLGKDDYIVNKIGRNKVVGGSYEDIWIVGGDYNFLTAATTIEAIGSDTDDTLAGLGARVITVIGLDILGNIIEEDINMNGLTVTTATTLSFFRVNQVVVKDVGTVGGSNYDDITIRASGGGVTVGFISGDETSGTATYGSGETQLSMYTIPLGYTGYISHMHVATDASKITTIALYKREDAFDVTAPVRARRLVHGTTLLGNSIDTAFDSLIEISELTDIWFRGTVNTGSSDITISYDIILVKKPIINYSIFWNTIVVKDQEKF